MTSAQEAVAALLQYLQVAFCTPSIQPAAHLDHGIDHGVCGGCPRGIVTAAGHQEHHAVRHKKVY